jgi:hypothetical protein
MSLFPRITGSGFENLAAASGRLQPALWDLYQRRNRVNDITEDGFFRFWDFDNWGDLTAAAVFMDGWKLRIDTGGTVTQTTTEAGGVITFATDNTDNDSIEMMECGGVGCVHVTSAGTLAVAFDCRVKFPLITNTQNHFYGLTATGSVADNGMFSDAGATADRGCIGFTVLEADGDALEFTWKKAGQTAQITSGLKAIAADTWYQLGFIFDPAEPNPARRLKIFIDNAVVAYVSATQIAAATFPSAVLLGAGIGLKNQTTAISSGVIDCMARAMAQ